MINLISKGAAVRVTTTTAEAIDYTLSYEKTILGDKKTLAASGVISTATTTTLIGTSGTPINNTFFYLSIYEMYFYNKGSSSNTIQIKAYDFTTTWTVTPAFTIEAGECLHYSNGTWEIIGAAGLNPIPKVTGTRKILGQVRPSATEGALYTCPSNTSTSVETITICNTAASDGTFRLSVSVGGGSTANTDYIYYDTPILANSTAVLGADGKAFVNLSASDVIRVTPSSSDIVFMASGEEFA